MKGKTIETVSEFEAIGQDQGGYVPLWLAAVVAGVSRQRMHTLWQEVDWSYSFYGGKFFLEKPLAQWIASEKRLKYKGCYLSTVQNPHSKQF